MRASRGAPHHVSTGRVIDVDPRDALVDAGGDGREPRAK
jgi:hypothetical protein